MAYEQVARRSQKVPVPKKRAYESGSLAVRLIEGRMRAARLSFSIAFQKENKIANATHIKISFDAEGKKLAISFLNKADPEAFALWRSSGTAYVEIGAILRRFKLQALAPAHLLEYKWDNRMGAAVVDLSGKLSKWVPVARKRLSSGTFA